MGLDIRAISKLRYIGLRCTDLTDCEFQGHVVHLICGNIQKYSLGSLSTN